MRQRRQRLQVSTFPFLAVLLCAMGSLILLLLVMDRRAKVVARAKATRAMEQAVAQITAEEEQAAAAHRAEWERRRQRLHEQLHQEEQQILRELQGVHSQLAAASGNVQTELARSQEMREQLQTERLGIARAEQELNARRAEIASKAQQADASRAELVRLTTDLERLEHCIADLQAARQRQQQMYSLVPYQGKRGDNRKPIYLECNGDDLIIHPNRVPLNESTIRDEIERRLAQQRAETNAVNGKPEENVYLLMLIRPNGISTYYRTLAALKGLQIEFGYEFIDQDWILDFTEADDKLKKQPWIAADRPEENQSSGSSAKEGPPGLTPSPRAQRPYKGLVSGGTGPGRRMGIAASAPAGSGNSDFGSSGAASPGSGNSGLRGGGTGVRREGVLDSAPVGNAAGVRSGVGQRGEGQPALGTRDGSVPSLADVLAGGSRPSAARAAFSDGNAATASPHRLGQGEPFSAQGGAPGETSTTQAVARGRPEPRAQPADSRMASGSATADPQMEGGRGGSDKSGLEAPRSLLPPVALNRFKDAGSSGGDASQEPASESAAGGNRAQGRSSSGEAMPGPASDPLDRLKSQSSTQKSVRAVSVRPGPLVSNRDWIIAMECTADALILFPGGQRIATAQLAKAESKNLLLETIQQMIARRQATVRPGEPPYRPMIRFRVRPDGLRSYHLAYPVLEALHVRMTRENMDPEEANPSHPAISP